MLKNNLSKLKYIMDIGKQIYEQTTEYGRMISVIQFYISLTIAIILIGISIYLITKNENHLINTMSKILSVQSTSYFENKRYRFNNLLNIEYTVDGKILTGIINETSDKPYLKDQMFEITYNKNNPQDIKPKQMRSRTIGFILIGIALFIGVVSYITKFLTSKYSILATTNGAKSIFNMIRY